MGIGIEHTISTTQWWFILLPERSWFKYIYPEVASYFNHYLASVNTIRSSFLLTIDWLHFYVNLATKHQYHRHICKIKFLWNSITALSHNFQETLPLRFLKITITTILFSSHSIEIIECEHGLQKRKLHQRPPCLWGSEITHIWRVNELPMNVMQLGRSTKKNLTNLLAFLWKSGQTVHSNRIKYYVTYLNIPETY